MQAIRLKIKFLHVFSKSDPVFFESLKFLLTFLVKYASYGFFVFFALRLLEL
jgi:hypothetical protein